MQPKKSVVMGRKESRLRNFPREPAPRNFLEVNLQRGRRSWDLDMGNGNSHEGVYWMFTYTVVPTLAFLEHSSLATSISPTLPETLDAQALGNAVLSVIPRAEPRRPHCCEA